MPIPKNKSLSDADDKRTRRARIVESGGDISLPEMSAPFLLSYLLEVGPIVSGPFGAGPIGWRDIEAWQNCIGFRLPPWQGRILIELSREYLSFSKTAEEADCLSPIADEVMIESRREAVAKSLRIGLRGLMTKGSR